MSIFSNETVKAIAESAGIDLKDDVANVLVQDMEYRLREIIHEATKFMRHSKRRKLSTKDINHALRIRNIEPLYGYSPLVSTQWKSLPLGSQKFYYLDEKEVDLDDIIYGPLPSVPLDVTYTAHWLAIDGVQPAIPQNPTPAEIKAMEMGLLKAGAKLTEQFTKNGVHVDTAGSAHDSTVKGVLSKELQLYYEKITEAVFSEDETLSASAMESLSQDPGLQSLLPYFVQLISEIVTKNLKNLKKLWGAMRTIRSLLDNPNLFIEPYLHQLMPSMITCIVAKKLSIEPTAPHWALRDFACLLVSHVCRQYGSSYSTMQPRVTKTLLRAFLDPMKSYATNYGAIVGLAALGHEVVKVLILPNIQVFGEHLKVALEMDVDKIQNDSQLNDEQKLNRVSKKFEAQKCEQAIVKCLRQYLNEERKSDPQFCSSLNECKETFGYFADKLVTEESSSEMEVE